MCGIVGQFNRNRPVSEDVFKRMCVSLAHRGPDDSGMWFNNDHSIAIGHTRLSFLDLSERGRQPMTDNSENLVITFNGEIYNYRILKKELSSDYEFKTDTDTEVILAGYAKWGIKVLDRLKGMFAFALYDRKLNKVFLVRDRFGIKPLYYSLIDDRLVFASEIKAILASEEVEKNLDVSSFSDYFVYRYIPSPKSIWQKVNKVPPAHYLEIDLQTFKHTSTEYWSLKSQNSNVSEKQLIEEIDELLQRSVEQHTIADVPIGSFLSGGYDSSALVYYAKKNGYDPATYSIGFENWSESEHHYAKVVADHLKVSNEATIADASSLDLLERMPVVYDEPIADISIVPTYMVSELARKQRKAVLSGEGADELFGGYTWQKDFFAQQYPKGFIEGIKGIFKKTDTVDFYANAMAMGWFDGDELKKMLVPELHQHINDDVHWFYRQHFNSKLSPLKSIQQMDIKCFMGELVLTKIDRASMANSLEVRVPFLDHELFEKIFAVSEKNYYKPNITKYLLHENLKGHLPDSIMQRRKQGFVGPDSYYMDLDWYRSKLIGSAFVDSGLIQPDYVTELLNNKDHWRLWKLTVMAKWYEHYLSA